MVMVVHLAQLVGASQTESFRDLLVFQLTGLIIVVIVLCSLWLAVSLVGKLFRALDLKDPESSTSPHKPAGSLTSSPSPLPPCSTPVTPEVLAVIGGALHTVIQGPFKIVSVEETDSDS